MITSKPKKLELINIVLISKLKVEDKVLLVELLMRCDGEWKCWPSVQRLCKARGIKHEKNFKGVDTYLPGFVTKEKQGRQNLYRINVAAVAGLSPYEVTIKHTPALSDTPGPAGDPPRLTDDSPGVAEQGPVEEGANSTLDTTKDSSQNSSLDGAVAVAPLPSLSLSEQEEDGGPSPLPSLETVAACSTSKTAGPAREGVTRERVEAEVRRQHTLYADDLMEQWEALQCSGLPSTVQGAVDWLFAASDPW